MTESKDYHKTAPRKRSESTSSTKTSHTRASKSGASSHGSRSQGDARQHKNGPGGSLSSFLQGRGRKLLPVVIVVVILIVGGVADVVSSFGKIHPGIQVQGIDVGGLTVDQAATKLETDLSPQLQKSNVSIYADDGSAKKDGATTSSSKSETLAYADENIASDVDGDGTDDKWLITTDTIGAHIDGTALAKTAYEVGRSNDPILGRIKAWLGMEKFAASVAYNQSSFDDLMANINDAVGTEVKESKISISDGEAKAKEGHDGWLVNEDAFVDDMSSAFFDTTAPYFVLPMETVSMHITKATAQSVANQVNSAISQTVNVTYDGKTWTLDTKTLGNLIGQKVLEPGQVLAIGDGTEKVDSSGTAKASYDISAGKDSASSWILQAYVNQEDVDSYLVDILGGKASTGAKNAKFDTSSGKVKIIPSEAGNGPDRAAAALELQNILFGTDSANRTITLVDTTVQPARTTADAQAMGITERLATWSIPLSGTSNRINNIELLCKLIDGSLIAPGENWSFNDTTGERTAAKGFQTAPVIIAGKHEDQLGGGICQVATCVFNAACYSGLGIVTRTNHDFYIPAYDDEGFADATVSWETPDLEWTNDMDTYILLTASCDSGSVVVSLWGTKDGRTVTCDRGEWKAGTKYTTIKEKDATLAEGKTEVEQAGQDGRSIDIRYLVKDKDGNVLHDVTFSSNYQAENEIIKVGTKKVSTKEASTKKA